MEESVILVDTHDNPTGLMSKKEAHEKGMLHRAFSIFVFNEKDELLLQQRVADKYHSPLLWTNTCCSHQRENETSLQAATRRLQEEMGFSCPLEIQFWFVYKAPFDNGLTEHELDHVLTGKFNGTPNINTEEVANYKWMPLHKIKQDITAQPQKYTTWFKIIFNIHYERLVQCL